MLAYILAVAVGLSSLALYMAAFFFPELHRKSDFYWSGLGLFYALILWVCAGRITGAVLLGQTAGVALLGCFAWQTISLRYILVAPEERTEVDPDLLGKIKGFLPTKLFTSFTNRSSKTAPEVEVEEEKDTSEASEANTEVELELPQDTPEPEVTTEISSEVEESETLVETIPDSEVADAEIAVETAETEVIASDTPVENEEKQETEEKQDEPSEAESQLQPKPQRKKIADTPEPQVTFEERVIQQRPTDKS